MIPIYGAIADGANSLWYAAEGDYTNAALSAAALIPFAGEVATTTKLGGKVYKAATTTEKAVDTVSAVTKNTAKTADKVSDAGKLSPNTTTKTAKASNSTSVSKNTTKSSSKTVSNTTQTTTTAKGTTSYAATSSKTINYSATNTTSAKQGKVTVQPESADDYRRTWRQSELEAESLAFLKDYDTQVSFFEGTSEGVRYGQKGSVRPDFYKEGHSIDIKNYNVETSQGRSSLVRNIEKQYFERLEHLPKGTKQTVLVDIRGQNLSQAARDNLIENIERRTNDGVEVLFWEKGVK